MLDFGWSELFLCLVVAVFAIGPKQIPDVLYWMGRAVRRVQYMKYALTAQFDDLMNVSEIENLRKQASLKADIASRTQEDVDAERDFDEDDLLPPVRSDDKRE